MSATPSGLPLSTNSPDTDTLQAKLLAATRQLLQEREAFYQVFEQTPALVTILRGPDHRFAYFNPAQERMFPGRQLLGQPLATVLPDAATQGFVALLDRVYATGEPHVGVEVPACLNQPNGPPPRLHYFTFAYQRFEEDGQPAGISVFGTDVTEQVRARQERDVLQAQVLAAVATDVTEQVTARQQVQALNDELTITNRQLTRTNTDLDTFVYTASHDLKRPVSNIEGLLLALLEELPPEVRQAGMVQPLLDRMQGAIERFQLTIAQLTDVARLRKAPAQPAEVVDLAVLVEDLRLDLAPLLATSGARLTLDVAACPQVSFAPQHLRSIVYTLLSNAVKYRHPNRPPHVQLRCRSTEALVVLEVEDNGLGLRPNQQGELFGLFRRLHDHVEGSGLGLYRVKRLVENAGGTIRVQSEAGVGSTFTVTLPRTASSCPVG